MKVAIDWGQLYLAGRAQLEHRRVTSPRVRAAYWLGMTMAVQELHTSGSYLVDTTGQGPPR